MLHDLKHAVTQCDIADESETPYVFRMSKLNGKVAVVTGGSSGIGYAIAKRFVSEGARVFITGRRADALERAAREIGAEAVAGDASNEADLDRLLKTVGRFDVLVANAGANGAMPLAEGTAAHFDQLFDANVRSVYLLVAKATPLLNDGGSIVLVASAMHAKGLPGLSVYSATKAAVRSFARSFAADLKERKIRVNSLSPGAVDTPLLVATVPDDQKKALLDTYSSWIPLGRVGRPEEMASAALFLASSESSYLTGSDIVADGGFTQL